TSSSSGFSRSSHLRSAPMSLSLAVPSSRTPMPASATPSPSAITHHHGTADGAKGGVRRPSRPLSPASAPPATAPAGAAHAPAPPPAGPAPLVVRAVHGRLDPGPVRRLAGAQPRPRHGQPGAAAAGRVPGQHRQVGPYLRPVQGLLGGGPVGQGGGPFVAGGERVGVAVP